MPCCLRALSWSWRCRSRWRRAAGDLADVEDPAGDERPRGRPRVAPDRRQRAAGLQGTGAEPVEQDTADAWAKTNQEPDATQLKDLEFVAGARQDLVGPPGAYALNLVERFATAEEAQERLTLTMRDLGNAKGRFEVSGVPGAVGFESGSGSKLGRSIAFSKGETVFLLSHQVAKKTPSVAQLKAAARKWYAAIP